MSFGKGRSRKTVLFCGLCCLIYFSSYVTRINYAAAIAEIVISLGTTKTLASMALTSSFITYGIGQIFSGIIGDHIKPRTMIFLGLLVTSLCNLIMFTLSNIYIMTVIWCINGFAQSMLWPPLTRIMSENLSPDRYTKTCVAVSASASVATIVIYLIVPLCIKFFSWRAVFLLSAIWGLAVGILWLYMVNKLTSASHIINEGITTEPIVTPKNSRTLLLYSSLIPIMIIILLQGILRDGITTWMPSYINDIYHFGTSISILSTAILPVFAIISVVVASYIHKLAKSEVKVSAFIWILALFCSSVLIVVFSSHAVVSILIMAIITGCMHGINLMLISVLPVRFKNTGHISTVSGILNAFTYGGSAISSYGIAALSDNFGWETTIITWCIIALCGAIINIACIRKWNRPQTI